MGYTVYKLTSPSNKVYIGITSQPVNKRWRYGKGYKNCTLMNRAIEKYGWENFKKEVLLENTTENEAKTLETMLIKLYQSIDPQYGYNLTEGGEGRKGQKLTDAQKEHLRQINLGKHHSEETRKKMSEMRKGNKYAAGHKHTEEWKRENSKRCKGANNGNSKRVICLETLKVYDTMTQAREETGATKITECCKHYYKHKSSAGLHWEYYDESISTNEYKEMLNKLMRKGA